MAPSNVEHHTTDSHESRFYREDFPFFWIVNVHAKYTQLMDIELKKVAMDVSRFRVLMLIHQYRKANISQISQYSVSKMPTVTKIVGRLRDDGLVETRVSEQDGRVTEAILTEAGTRKALAVMEISQRIFTKAFKGISPAQARKMNQILSGILDNLDD